MGILKNTKNIFIRYKNPYLKPYDRFVKPEDKSRKREEIVNAFYANPTFAAYLKYLNATKLTRLPYLENNISGLLDRFTDDEVSDEEIAELQASIEKRNAKKIVSITTEGRDKMTITLKDRVIEAERLSHKYPLIAQYHPDILTLKGRKGKCHIMGMTIASGLGDDVVMATGTMYTTIPTAKYLHTWVEEVDHGEEYCYDFTYNLALKKQDYYYLFHAVPYEKITAKQLDEDKYKVMKLLDHEPIYTKLYMSSRAEAMKIADTLPDKDYSDYMIDGK